MTQVCLVGDDDVELRYELLSRETSREALSTYDLRAPYQNTIALDTVSLGAAVSLVNDLNWYLIRFVNEALVKEPSVSETEWLSRDLAKAIRDDDIAPEESERFLKVYGVVRDDPDSNPEDGADDETAVGNPLPRLVEPMLVTRTGETLPDYDLRPVEDTVRVRVTEDEFEA
ncbi:DUF5804 family protein [Halobacteriales archaeon Cl-PHB]